MATAMGREREKLPAAGKAVEGGGGDWEEQDGGPDVAGWMPRMPMRVLLAEGDDSTRQVIAALLRKCGYRVSAASDGMKAWETLKEKACHIDIVLAEVELPLMSGFVLLSMIMEYEPCKNISVIMMSCHDSMSMVFKCMLKGAVDFLVKPIRKNELRNMWQHVWRKQLANGGADIVRSVSKDGHPRTNPEPTASPMKQGHCDEDVASKLGNRDFDEQESDVQSSCTRSELETDSKQAQKVKSCKLPTPQEMPTMDRSSDELMHLQDASGVHARKSKGRQGNDLTKIDCNACETAPEATEQALFLGALQPCSTSAGINSVKIPSQTNDITQSQSWMNPPDSSLWKSSYSSLHKKDNTGQRALNHSSSSPFSLYNDNRSSMVGRLPNITNLEVTTDPEPKTVTSGATGSPKATLAHCKPIRVVPFVFPTYLYDRSPYGSAPPAACQIDSTSTQPFWHAIPLMPTEALKLPQSDLELEKASNAKQVEEGDAQSIRSTICNSARQERSEPRADSQQNAPSSTGWSQRSSISDDMRALPTTSNGCDALTGDITPQAAPCNNHRTALEDPNADPVPVLSYRDMALNKFRLKRKERCFEKKVRYESRRLLAEQRPRVKGQFVRHGPLKDAASNNNAVG